ncbi:hypothetical protein TNCV_3494521 [Trichonephila clavipes]|nr:hypothetical protein TNCV_3494521 [Trichonephila clavipes]
MSPIEHEWHIVGQRIARDLRPVASTDELWLRIQTIWNTLPQTDIISFHAEIVKVEIGGVAIYRHFGEFRRAKSYCHLYGDQGQRQAYIAPFHDEFRGPRSDYVRQVALETTTTTSHQWKDFQPMAY